MELKAQEMHGDKRKKRNDSLLILGILTVMGVMVLVLWLVVFQDGTKAVLIVDDTVILEQNLTQDCHIPIPTEQGYNLFKVEDGKATIEEADCKDQICVEHIPISKAGETIVCLPHKLVIEIQ